MKTPLNIDYGAIWESFISNGNEKALSLIYNDHYDLLYHYGLKYTHDIQVIEDSIQNTFGYFLKRGGNLFSVSNLKGFLLKSFRNQLLSELKRVNRFYISRNFSQENDDCHEPEVNEIFEQEWHNRLEQKLRMSMKQLTARQKEILFLKYQCNLSYNEIANMLDIEVDSCYKLVYRSLKELRDEIDKLEVISKRMILFLMTKLKPH